MSAIPKPEPDNLPVDHYASYLAEVNKENKVTSTEDIRNAKGVLVVRKGAQIDSEAAQHIVQHKLAQPLEHSIHINDSLDGSALQGYFQRLVEKYPDLNQIHEAHDFARDCERCMAGRPLHPLLIQKLTVLRLRMPDVFEKGLFCAWLAALITRELALDGESVYGAYLAGLLHDVGFLHISPAIMTKKGPLDAAEWRAIQSHVVIGRLVLESVPGLTPRVACAVQEHHERCDGTGYPAGKSQAQLDQLGQIVGLADSLQAIRVNQFAGVGRNLRDAMPYLQLNSTTHGYPVYQAVMAILKHSGLQSTPHDPCGDLAAFAANLRDRAALLPVVIGDLGELLADLLAIQLSSRGKALRAVTERVLAMVISSGLAREELRTWLGAIHHEPDASALMELNEVELMINELFWQIKNMRNVFNAFYEKECKPDAANSTMLLALMERIGVNLAAKPMA